MHNKTVSRGKNVTRFPLTLSAEPSGILGFACSAASGLPVHLLLPVLSMPVPSPCPKKGSDDTGLTEEPCLKHMMQTGI